MMENYWLFSIFRHPLPGVKHWAGIGLNVVAARSPRRAGFSFICVCILVLTPLTIVRADEVADFYRGRRIELVVGFGPGGGNDVYARLLARHIGQYLPGNPNVVVQNMPGAGSLRAANYIYSVAPKDGATFGLFARDMALLALLGGDPNVQFDPRKFSWLGSSSSYADDAYLLMLRKDAAVRSIADARRPGGPPMVLGGTAEGSTGNDVPILLRDLLRLNIRLVTGYRDSGVLFLAIDQNEVEGRTVGLSAVRSAHRQWLAPDSNMRVLLQFGRATRLPEFADAPTARELAPDSRSRGLIELAELPYLLSRPFAAPPDLPPARAKALQTAFMAVQKDPQYLAEAQQLDVEVSPIGAEAALRAIERLAETPVDLREQLKKLLAQTRKN